MVRLDLPIPTSGLLLDEALGALTARQRAVVVLRYDVDLSERDRGTAVLSAG